MHITAIKTDASGLKMISANAIYDLKGCKPYYSAIRLFDFNPAKNLLRIFWYDGDFTSLVFDSYRAALKYIFSL